MWKTYNVLSHGVFIAMRTVDISDGGINEKRSLAQTT